MDTVADLMVKDVLTVDPSDSIGEAAEKMNAANVGAVVVVEDFARIVGIVTERDLMRAVAARARAAEARVRQWMTPDPVTIEPDVSIEEAAHIMFDEQLPAPSRREGRAPARDRQPPAPLPLGLRPLERVRRTARLGSLAVIRLFPERGGWLEVVCGPMFSGKSEELIRRLRRAEIAGQRALIVKPRIDDRYDIGHVVSHAGAKMRAVAVSRPEEIPGLAESYDVIGIDEVQFFTPSIVLAIEVLVERGTRVVVSGLDQDFRGLPFGSMPELLCRAELVDKLQAVCHRCGGPATMTQRLVDGRPAPADGATIVVGALDSYEARCRACHELAEPASATG